MAGSFTHVLILNRCLEQLDRSSVFRTAMQEHIELARFASVFPDAFYYGDVKADPTITRFTDWLHKDRNTSFVLKLFEQLKEHDTNEGASETATKRRVALAAGTLTHIAGDIIVHPEVDNWLERYSRELDPRDKNGEPLKMEYYENYIPHSQCELTHDCSVFRRHPRKSFRIETELDADLRRFIERGYRAAFPERDPPTDEEQQATYKRFRIAYRYLAICNGRFALPPFFYSRGRNFPFSLRGKREQLFLDGFDAVVERAVKRAAEFLTVAEQYHTDRLGALETLETIGEWGLDHGTEKEIGDEFKALFR